jgi:hypothetical protein
MNDQAGSLNLGNRNERFTRVEQRAGGGVVTRVLLRFYINEGFMVILIGTGRCDGLRPV